MMETRFGHIDLFIPSLLNLREISAYFIRTVVNGSAVMSQYVFLLPYSANYEEIVIYL